jgi:hypothetical protein
MFGLILLERSEDVYQQQGEVQSSLSVNDNKEEKILEDLK